MCYRSQGALLFPHLPPGVILNSVGFRPSLPEGYKVGRRGVKEYRAGEALSLIAADRDGKTLACPSCGATTIERSPRRSPKGAPEEAGRVTLHCGTCGRSAVYLSRPDRPPPERLSPTYPRRK